MTASATSLRRLPPAAWGARPHDAGLAALRNLGPRSAQMLAAAGISSVARLRRVGAVTAFVRARRIDPAASLNLLYALVGALDGTPWQQVRRTRKLELLIAVEDEQRRQQARGAGRSADTRGQRKQQADLAALRNIGPAMLRDFELLGIRSVGQLARADADRLYRQLQQRTGRRHDPCVWDTFAAAIHQARGGEALPWWQFTPLRKQRMAEGSFAAPFAPTGVRTRTAAQGRATARAARRVRAKCI